MDTIVPTQGQYGAPAPAPPPAPLGGEEQTSEATLQFSLPQKHSKVGWDREVIDSVDKRWQMGTFEGDLWY